MHVDEQQSPFCRLPSSHASPASSTPLPHRLPSIGENPGLSLHVYDAVNAVDVAFVVPLTVKLVAQPPDVPLAAKTPVIGSIVPGMLNAPTIGQLATVMVSAVPTWTTESRHSTIPAADTFQPPLMSTDAAARVAATASNADTIDQRTP